ncbi:MarR family transcriptional regulator [Streptomyces sp. NBC_01275]|uniref:MarR family winged helix-turn-helix transcriptional regulator n=1 Tax=Streptomyces sp. NBC_01275 TaxID=2903807 RepID=UPI002258616E|nr:MarR family transcriptional regulator [Streptomyces sp. NBC_01275]MCX4761545.1 MarR family transcriptional regulator [Streptomyces sp. NBC_01275]
MSESARWRERIVEMWRVTQRLDRALLRGHGITLSEFLALSELDRAGTRLRAKDLAEAIALSPSSVSRLLDRLERGGLVSRKADLRDRRAAFVRITDPGARTVRAAAETFGARVDTPPAAQH